MKLALVVVMVLNTLTIRYGDTIVARDCRECQFAIYSTCLQNWSFIGVLVGPCLPIPKELQ